MSKPVSISFSFASQTGPIPLSELDTNFDALAAATNDFGTYSNFLIDSSGAANSITVATPGGTTFSYVAGQFIQVQIANSTTGAVTINVNGLGAKPVVNADGTALPAGAFTATQILLLQYDGTSFRSLGASKTSSAAGVTSFTSNTGLSTNVAATGAVSVTNTGVLSIAGTANQIAASSSAGAVTLSLPQNVVIPTPATGSALQFTGAAGSNAAFFIGSSTASNSFGPVVQAGTNASDRNILFVNAANSVNFAQIVGDGSVVIGAASGGAQGGGTINAQGIFVNGVAVSTGANTTTKVATAIETRTTTTAQANSTQLTAALAATGTYGFRIVVSLFVAGPGAGVGLGVNYSGSFTAASSPIGFAFNPSGTSVAGVTANVATTPTAQTTNTGTASSSIPWQVVIEGTLTATSTGTLSLNFAQQASSANTTTLMIGSNMTITKLA